MKAAIRPDLATIPHGVFEYDVDGQRFHLRVDEAGVQAREGAAPDAEFVLHLTLESLIRIARRELDPFEAVRRGVVRLEGDEDAYHRSAEMFAMTDPPRSAAKAQRNVRLHR